jgi:hypothetical protein
MSFFGFFNLFIILYIIESLFERWIRTGRLCLKM